MNVLLHILLFLLFPSPTSAVIWYFLRYFAPADSNFTSLSGTMTVPPLPSAATYYLWPGLQPRDSSGVYQNVLDGRTGTWWFGSGWCCSNPTLPWGGGFPTQQGDAVRFDNVLGPGGWRATITREVTEQIVTDSFAVGDKAFNQALFAIELFDAQWDFGRLVFTNVVITATGTDPSWCTDSPENYNGASVYSVSGVWSKVGADAVTCNIASLILERPA